MTNYKAAIAASGLSIYDELNGCYTDLYIPTNLLQLLLRKHLIGLSLAGLPLRTRSKEVKTQVCMALGYPVPKSFKKVQPRFYGQNLDVYTQKSLNVQIWNEEIEPDRRYAFLHVTEDDVVDRVRVITGTQLAEYDSTGTLTTKYQARMPHYDKSKLLSPTDTNNVAYYINGTLAEHFTSRPNNDPTSRNLLTIRQIYERLLPLVGRRIHYIDAVQERNRGAELHSMICAALGYTSYEDDGSYPDIKNQLLEIKLQTSPTIDLGLHSPEDGAEILHVPGTTFYSEDIRYAVIDGVVFNEAVEIRNIYLVNGHDFVDYFTLFQGKKQNAKLQMMLPQDFFD